MDLVGHKAMLTLSNDDAAEEEGHDHQEEGGNVCQHQ